MTATYKVDVKPTAWVLAPFSASSGRIELRSTRFATTMAYNFQQLVDGAATFSEIEKRKDLLQGATRRRKGAQKINCFANDEFEAMTGLHTTEGNDSVIAIRIHVRRAKFERDKMKSLDDTGIMDQMGYSTGNLG